MIASNPSLAGPVLRPTLGQILGTYETYSKELPGDAQNPAYVPEIMERPEGVSGEEAAGRAGSIINPDSPETAAQRIVTMVPVNPAADKQMRLSRQVRSALFSYVYPEPLPDPVLLCVSKDVCEKVLGIEADDENLLNIIAGISLPRKCRPRAQNYGGHQYGYYAGQLGDGRCISLGEVLVPSPKNPNKQLIQEINLKGSGKTPYSRFGDGRAILSSSFREFIASEYLAALGVPTTRALALLGSTLAVYRDKGMESGAVVARVCPSWIRFGTFELFHYRGEKALVKDLADYVIRHHYPHIDNVADQIEERGASSRKDSNASEDVKSNWSSVLKAPNNLEDAGLAGPKLMVATLPSMHVLDGSTESGEKQVIVDPFAPSAKVEIQLNKYARLFKEIIRKTAIMVAHWQSVGFIHGVLNTDNMSILGVTIDFGPYMFLDTYDPWMCCNSSDEIGRYRFEHQPKIVLWNLSKLGRTMADLFVLDEAGNPLKDINGNHLDGRDMARQLLMTFEPIFIEKYTDLMRKKLGFKLAKTGDLENIILPLLWILTDSGADYTNFFLRLCHFKTSDDLFEQEVGPPVEAPVGVEMPEEYIKEELKKAAMASNVDLGRRSRRSSQTPIVPPEEKKEQETTATSSRQTSKCLELLLSSLAVIKAKALAEWNETLLNKNKEDFEDEEYSDARLSTIRRSERPVDGYLSLKPISTEDLGKRQQNATARESSSQESESENKNDDNVTEDENAENENGGAEGDIFGPWLASEQEITYRWQKWAKQYRSRLLLEQAASKLTSKMEAEDQRRYERMRTANPRFNLRGWILEDISQKLSQVPELQPYDAEMERLQADLSAVLDAMKDVQSGHGFRRDNKPGLKPLVEDVDIEKPTAPLKKAPSAEIDRALRILIHDVWGSRSDSKLGWDNHEDEGAAKRWGGPIPPIAQLMVASGARIPRFFVQLIYRDYHRNYDNSRPHIPVELFVFFVTAGFKLYGTNMTFKDDDVIAFENLLHTTTVGTEESIGALSGLLDQFDYMPVGGLGSPLDEVVYMMSKIHMPLIDKLTKKGFPLSDVNDSVLERVFWKADLSESDLQGYFKAGFRLSSNALKRGIQMGRATTLAILRKSVSPSVLHASAEHALRDMLGPTHRGWAFNIESLEFVLREFEIPESVMESALLREAGPNSGDVFPATRSYMKVNPCPVWNWVLQKYGPSHKFTVACFDDALARASADPDLHNLHDIYLEGGVKFHARHVKILACRVLHRHMTSNALHLIKAMRQQVIATIGQRLREISRQSTTSSTDDLQRELVEIQRQWERALDEEIVNNETWDFRMRTMQLEGGSRGSAFRISQPPQDALGFLEEAREFLLDLQACANILESFAAENASSTSTTTTTAFRRSSKPLFIRTSRKELEKASSFGNLNISPGAGVGWDLRADGVAHYEPWQQPDSPTDSPEYLSPHSTRLARRSSTGRTVESLSRRLRRLFFKE